MLLLSQSTLWHTFLPQKTFLQSSPCSILNSSLGSSLMTLLSSESQFLSSIPFPFRLMGPAGKSEAFDFRSSILKTLGRIILNLPLRASSMTAVKLSSRESFTSSLSLVILFSFQHLWISSSTANNIFAGSKSSDLIPYFRSEEYLII